MNEYICVSLLFEIKYILRRIKRVKSQVDVFAT
jgi:hypothetical protein